MNDTQAKLYLWLPALTSRERRPDEVTRHYFWLCALPLAAFALVMWLALSGAI